MRPRLLTALALVLLSAPLLFAQQDVVPALQEWKGKKGKFTIADKSTIVVDPSTLELIKADLDIFLNDLYARLHWFSVGGFDSRLVSFKLFWLQLSGH